MPRRIVVHNYLPARDGAGEYVSALQQAGSNRQQFEVVLSQLKNLPKEDLIRVSQEYGQHKYKGSKEQMLSEIQKTFVRNARFANKLK